MTGRIQQYVEDVDKDLDMSIHFNFDSASAGDNGGNLKDGAGGLHTALARRLGAEPQWGESTFIFAASSDKDDYDYNDDVDPFADGFQDLGYAPTDVASDVPSSSFLS